MPAPLRARGAADRVVTGFAARMCAVMSVRSLAVPPPSMNAATCSADGHGRDSGGRGALPAQGLNRLRFLRRMPAL